MFQFANLILYIIRVIIWKISSLFNGWKLARYTPLVMGLLHLTDLLVDLGLNRYLLAPASLVNSFVVAVSLSCSLACWFVGCFFSFSWFAYFSLVRLSALPLRGRVTLSKPKHTLPAVDALLSSLPRWLQWPKAWLAWIWSFAGLKAFIWWQESVEDCGWIKGWDR